MRVCVAPLREMALYDEKAFAEKLSKLTCAAQSIETISQWCLFHRKRSREARRSALCRALPAAP